MMLKALHSWDLTPAQAISLQKELAGDVIISGEVNSVRFIGGADISMPRGSRTARAAIVVLSYPELEIVEIETIVAALTFPYVPGLLSFREAPLVLELFEKLNHKPDLLIVDGQGIAHPRRLGIASHLGLWLDIPVIGCAKSRLCGEQVEVGFEAGSQARLIDQGEVIGTVLRTRSGSKPLYISSGHRISLEESVRWALACTRGYRLPEPSRLAHLAAGGNLPGVKKAVASLP
ncbi:MAG: deoxyribonuclease V [Dehalococcoidia bacterium]|nr:MAG: deoxyribonuclease V [Dehalococcoidia bacterium]